MKSVSHPSSTRPAMSVHHNSPFSIEDIEVVLSPLFGSYYGADRLRSIIVKSEEKWCVYDEQRGQYVACALLSHCRKENILYIKLFGVQPSSQGQGIGTRLLETIKRWARKRNYVALLLHTQLSNHRAIGLYEKVGFHKQYYLENFFHRHGRLPTLASHDPHAYQMILYL